MIKKEDYTIKELAAIIGIQPHAVRKQRREGKYPNAYRLDPGSQKSNWMIPKKDAEKELKKRGLKPKP